MSTLKTVIDLNKKKIDNKVCNIKKSENWITPYDTKPTYFDIQEQVISLLDLTIKTNNFVNLEELTQDEAKLLKENILTLLSLSLNFTDLMNYDFEEWLDNAN